MNHSLEHGKYYNCSSNNHDSLNKLLILQQSYDVMVWYLLLLERYTISHRRTTFNERYRMRTNNFRYPLMSYNKRLVRVNHVLAKRRRLESKQSPRIPALGRVRRAANNLA